jgi:amidohydrolase
MNWTETRKELHKHPEVSGEEQNTSDLVIKKLAEFGLTEIHRGFSEHSIIAELIFEKAGRTVLFRCELDALPIKESNTFDYRSKNEGVSHKCGHDGHITIMLGLIEKLKENPLKKGRAIFLFQSSEEDGIGAKSIIDSGKLKELSPIDRVIALHNVPGFKKNTIVCKNGSFTPSVESVDIHLRGKESHAGMPENGVGPAPAIAKLIDYFAEIHNPDASSNSYFLSTPIQLKMGQPAYGTAAGDALLSYTFRSWEFDFFQKQKKQIIDKIGEIVKATSGLSVDLDWKQAFDANINEEDTVKAIKKATSENDLNYINKNQPFPWGEDFGTFTQEFQGAMFGLGSGKKTPELHNPDYDFPDEIRKTGIDMFYSLAKITLL